MHCSLCWRMKINEACKVLDLDVLYTVSLSQMSLVASQIWTEYGFVVLIQHQN